MVKNKIKSQYNLGELSSKMGALEERGILTNYLPIDTSYNNFMWNTEFMLGYQQRKNPKLLKRLEDLDWGEDYPSENKDFVGIQRLFAQDISNDLIQAIKNTSLFPEDFTPKTKTFYGRWTVICFNKGETIKDGEKDRKFRINASTRQKNLGRIGLSHLTYCTDEKRFFEGVYQGQKIKITLRELATAYIYNISGRKFSIEVPNEFSINL